MLLQKHGRSSSFRPTLADIQNDTAFRAQLGDRLVEKWNRTKAGAALVETYRKDKNRARRAAIALQQQANYLKTLTESTIKSNFLTTPENVLKIVRIGVANSNRANIFEERQLDTPDDAIFFIDRTYGTPRVGATQMGPAGGQRYGMVGDRIYDTIAPDHATESFEVVQNNISVSNSGSTTINFTAAPVPLVRMHVSVSITTAGPGRYNTARLVARDDGNGNLVSSIPGISGTVNYTTGEVSLTLDSDANNALASAFNGQNAILSYSWDSEIESNFDEQGQIDIKVSKKRFNARPHPLGFNYSKLAQLTLESTRLGNIEDMLVRAIGDEHALRRDYKAIIQAMRLAHGNEIEVFDADFDSAHEDNDYNHAQRVLSTISDTSGKLFNEIGRGVINRIVAGSRAITYFKKNRLWKPDTSQPRVGGTYLAGYLDEIAVYACRSNVSRGLPADNEALLIYKNPDEEGDFSIVFGVMTELVAALDFPDLYRQGTVATVEDSMVVEPRYIRKLQIINIP
jgi:hypothetical protein